MNGTTTNNGNTGIMFPQFVPNQVLTDTQLNLLRDYLDQQERTTRSRLIGDGIVCGFNWDWLATASTASTDHKIEVSSGYGLSSDGYLIELQKAAEAPYTYTHFKEYRDPEFDETKPAYDSLRLTTHPWADATSETPTPIKIFELLEAQATGSKPLNDLGGLDTSHPEWVLVLYLERNSAKLNACFVTNCDNKGYQINLKVKPLLIKWDDFIKSNSYKKSNSYSSYASLQSTNLPRIKIKRLTASALPDMLVEYIHSNTGALHNIDERINNNEFKKAIELLGYNITFLTTPFDNFKDIIPTSATAINQYHYDAVRDVIDALNEFSSAAAEVLPSCFSLRNLQRHLVLGKMKWIEIDETADYQKSSELELRSEFVPSPVGNATQGDIKRLRKLLSRLAAMMSDFNPELAPTSPIRITPSNTLAHPLGARAVPFYFGWGDEIKNNWKTNAFCTSEPLWSYNEENESALQYDYNRCSFLRIEGHLGKTFKDVSTGLRQLQIEGNAEFRVLKTFMDLDAKLAGLRNARNDELDKFGILEKILYPAIKTALDDDLLFFSRERQSPITSLQVNPSLLAWFKGRDKATELAAMDCVIPLFCDTAYLEADYLELCSGLRCELKSLKAHLDYFKRKNNYTASLANKARANMLTQGVKPWISRLGADYAIWTLRKLAILKKAPIQAAASATDNFQDVIEAWLVILKIPLVEVDLSGGWIDPVNHILLGLQFAASTLGSQIESLLIDCLPKDLCAFDYGEFIKNYKIIEETATRLWLAYNVFEAVIIGSVGVKQVLSTINVLTHQEEEDFLFNLFGVIHSCLPARFSSLHAAYQQLREDDNRCFDKLKGSVDGLEHLAGVEKGGSFVLVFKADDDDIQQSTVVADFSLAGQIPCCCKIDTDKISFPLVARPIYYIYILKQQTKTITVTINIDILANAYDPNASSGNPVKLYFNVVLPTILGAIVTPLSGDGGSVSYEIANPQPGAIDEFSYWVATDPRQTVPVHADNQSRVFILFLAEFPSGHEHGDHPGKWCCKNHGNQREGVHLTVG
ncbi:MAG: hypothetical protein ACOYMG_01260 [Candidatus Methylumidiphilus sp.]